MRARIILALATVVSVASAATAHAQWVELKSPHFTVVSDAGDKTARNVAWQFEQVRAAILAGWPWARVQLDRPVTIVAAKDEPSMKLLLPQFWEKGDRDTRPASVFVTTADRHFITLRSDVKGDDTPGVNPYFTSYWSYSMLAMDEAFERPLPLWFRSGLAEVLGNSIVRDNEIQFGRAVPWDLAILQQESRPRLAELFEVTASSPYYTDGATRRRFDANCWGLMHYLLFGRPEERVDHVNQLARLLLDGKTSGEAVQQVYGSIELLEQAYLQYERRPITQYARLKVETTASSKSFPAQPLAPPDAVVLRAALHTAVGRAVDARALIAEARKTAPEAAGSYDVEGVLLDREGKGGAARASYAKAVDLKSNNFLSHYRLALLSWGTRPDAETLARIESLLRQSIALNDAYAPSYALLADAIALGPKPADALEPAIRAAKLDPSETSIRLSLARVLWQLSRRDEAMGQARAGRALARSDRQRTEAEELIAFFGRAPQN